MRNRSPFIAGIIDGLTSPVGSMAESRYPLLQGSDLSRMREDVVRVGGDFQTVIMREHVKTKTSNKQAT